MAATRSSNDINAEIAAFGPALFVAVRDAVRGMGTLPPGLHRGSAAHRDNQRKLDDKIAELLAKARPDRQRDLSPADLWKVLWGRIAYAGTRASKASAEIAAMPQIPLFADYRNFDATRHRFDKEEWKAFRSRWQARLKAAGASGPWLAWAKAQGTQWADSVSQDFKNTTPEVVQLMTHTGLHARVPFSALDSKMEKYLDVAAFLNSPAAKARPHILHHYTGGSVFGDRHPEGADYLRDSALRARVQRLFAIQVGRITALHAMMDLGLRTVKPDRVITWLFSRLGWLQTLPATLEKEVVTALYTDPRVVEEVLARADVLAACIATEEEPHTHRLIDIWFVKYGQEPEADFGIAVNLQAKSGGIRAVYETVRASLANASLDPAAASERWPIPNFQALEIEERDAAPRTWPTATHRRPRRRTKVVARDEAEGLFMTQWRRGRESDPDLYPLRLDNEPKEAIIDLIERGWDPESAFLNVLRPEAVQGQSDPDE